MVQNFTNEELKELETALSWRIDGLYSGSIEDGDIRDYEKMLINLQKKVTEYIKEE